MTTWEVTYEDGTTLAEYQGGVETPFQAIDWPRVRKLHFGSNQAQATWAITPMPYFQYSLRRRGWISLAGAQISVLMFVVSRPGEVTANTTLRVVYWTPTGMTHDCDQLDCAVVATWAAGQVHGTQTALPATH